MPSVDESTRVEDDSLTSVRELLAQVLSDPSNQGTLFGSFILHEELGRGGFGIVFRARRVGSGELVALKQMRGGTQATAEERREFLAGAETALVLDHPGIVRTIELGEIAGCPFFTMPLVSGGNLAAKLDSAQPSHAQAAKWVASIARAVHHAHSREVLHRDLKPANILLDEHGEPLVADFGSARRLSKQGECLESGNGVLSFYMAPEQASGVTTGLTRRADIYSLGVLLHELLTGRVPYEGLSFADWVSELVSDAPVHPPRELEPSINRDLERVCLKCLEKDPSRRYESALFLAEDLERLLLGRRPQHARPDRVWSRGLSWLSRKPLRTTLIAWVLLSCLVLASGLASLWQLEREQQRVVLETNAFIANSQAGALLFQLREFADRAERCGQRPAVRQVLAEGSVLGRDAALESCARGFHSVYLTSLDGRLLARWPQTGSTVLGKNYSFRDYFVGASQLGQHGVHGAFLGPAYRAESNGLLQFALSAPVFDDAGAYIGVVVASQTADSAIGQVRLQDARASGRVVALLGPRGRDRIDSLAPAPASFDFVVHPRLQYGHEVRVREPVRSSLERAFGADITPGDQFSMRWVPPLLVSDYRDPLLEPGTESLAAFVPVGRTGYAVVVETSKDAVLRDGRALLSKLAWRAGVPFAAGSLLLGFWAMANVRRKHSLQRRARSRHAPAPGE